VLLVPFRREPNGLSATGAWGQSRCR
jgi:hypothetical protein